MSKEQKSAESDNDEQANESSRSLSQNEDNRPTKHATLDILSETMLQDLPIEILELILIKAVVMEVKDLKLAKCAWKEKADPVISRLKQVCWQWNNVLTSDHFRTVLHRTLDDTAHTIRLEVLKELSVKEEIHAMATLKDEIFTLCEVSDHFYIINVYDRDNIEVVKDGIKLPEALDVKIMTACTASNSLYVGLTTDCHKLSSLLVLRIWKDAQHQFNMSPWKHVYERSIHMLSITANGGLLTFTYADSCNPASVAVHDANDCLQLEVFLPRYLRVFRYIIQKSNGNLVLSYDTEKDYNTKLVEISTTSVVVRHYESSLEELSRVNFADDFGRIMISEDRRMELLDSEFNLLGVYRLEQDKGKSFYVCDLYYDRERSVIMRSHFDRHSEKNVLTIFRFTEE